MQTRPVHFGGHEHEKSSPDPIVLGATKLKPLGYALLRAEGTTLSAHRLEQIKAIERGFLEMKKQTEKVNRQDAEMGLRHFRQQARLHVWDQIQMVHELCDRLACVFDSVSRWQDDPATVDLGESIVRFAAPADETIGQSRFGDLSWWRETLMIDPDPDRYALLDDRQKALLDAVLRSSGDRLPVAIETVRTVYTRELHRLAVRARHGVTLLDPELGWAWIGPTPEEQAQDYQDLRFGALAVADTVKRKGTEIVQYLMPINDDNLLALYSCLKEAHWLSWALCSAVILKAETEASVCVVANLEAPLAASRQELMDMTIAYTGYDPELHEREEKRIARTETVYAAAGRLPFVGRLLGRKRVG